MKKTEHFFIELCRQMILLTSPEVPQSFRSWKTVFQSIGIRSVSWLDCATWRFRPLFWYVLMHSMELSVASWGVPPRVIIQSSPWHRKAVTTARPLESLGMLPVLSSPARRCRCGWPRPSTQVEDLPVLANLKRTNGGFRTMLGESYPLVNKHSYWKLWFIVDLPIKNGDFP